MITEEEALEIYVSSKCIDGDGEIRNLLRRIFKDIGEYKEEAEKRISFLSEECIRLSEDVIFSVKTVRKEEKSK